MQEQREKLKIKRAELAKRVGVTYDMIRKIEAGERTPSLTLAAKIALELKTTVQRLFILPSTHTKNPHNSQGGTA